jgi:LysM repeat protein
MLMRRKRLFFLLLLVSLGMTWTRNVPEVAAQGGPAAEILRLVNGVRAEHGLPPYRYNALLSIPAQEHATWMAANVIYSHTGAGGTSPQDRANAVGYNGYVAENIVGGTGMTPNQGVIWWRNSAIHYQMMVSNRYVEAGVGFASNGSENMYVLVMGRPSNSSAPPPTTAEPQAEPLIVTPIVLAEPREDGSIVHTVAEGQALWQIAAHYEVDLRDLLLYNGLGEDDFIQPGDEIIVRLPEGAPPPPTPTPPLTHTVREGENAWIIAARYDVSLDTFFYLNQLTEDSVLHPGNEVRIRLAEGEPSPPTPTPKLAHVVREGDSLWGIAAQNGLSVDELLSLNGIGQDTVLQIGQQLYIRPTETPVATATAAVTPTPTVDGLAAVAAAAIAVPETPTALPTPTATKSGPAAANASGAVSQDATSSGGGMLYAASLLIAVAGILVFIVVLLKRSWLPS